MVLKTKKIFKAEKESVPTVKKFVEGQLLLWDLHEDDIKDIVLACDEACANIVMYAYKDDKNNSKKNFSIELKKRGKIVKIIITDNGKEFNILNSPPPDIKQNLKGKREGGFGVFLMKNMMDRIKYKYEEEKNIVKLIKKTI
ncbi:MAG: ATP-binding protein [Spirochaetia bacterium]|nr:ATP-binding protein [Spirochaetia bacterium]